MKRKKRLKRFLKVFLPIFLVVVIVGGSGIIVRSGNSAAVWDPSKKSNVWVNKTKTTWTAAQSVGNGKYPENTMLAYKSCAQSKDFKADLLWLDVRITADNELIVLNSDTLEPYTGDKVKIADTNYADLRNYNLGLKFKASDGSTPYASLSGSSIPDDLKVTKLADVLSYVIKYKTCSFVIKIGDKGTKGKLACDVLYKLLKDQGLVTRCVVWFSDGKLADYLDEKYDDLPRGSSAKELAIFYCNARFNMNRAPINYKYEVLFAPGTGLVNYVTTNFINYAHKHNRAVFYIGGEGDSASKYNSKSADAALLNVTYTAAAAKTEQTAKAAADSTSNG